MIGLPGQTLKDLAEDLLFFQREDVDMIGQLTGVDVAIAGGGDELLANPGDLLAPGDDASDIAGSYPLVGRETVLDSIIAAGGLTDRGGDAVTEAVDTALVRQDGKFLYVVRNGIPIMLIDRAIAASALS